MSTDAIKPQGFGLPVNVMGPPDRFPGIPVTVKGHMKRTRYKYPQGQRIPDDYRRDLDDHDRRTTWEHTTCVVIQPEPNKYAPPKRCAKARTKLKSQFRGHGLQVIATLANIELSSERPDYKGGSWQI